MLLEEKDTTATAEVEETEQQSAEDTSTKDESEEKAESTTDSKTMDELGITKREDNKLEWKTDPEDPKTTVYVGENLTELMLNIRKGISEKDSVIRKAKAEQVIKRPDRLPTDKKKEESADENMDLSELLPDRDKIFEAKFKDTGLEPNMANWDNKKWREYSDDKELRDFEVTEIKQRVYQIVQSAQTEYTEKSVEYLNAEKIEDATQNIRKFLSKKSVDPEEYVALYEQALSNAWHDKDSKRNGVIVSGAIETEFYSLFDDKNGTKAKTKIEVEIEKKRKEADDKKKKIQEGGGGGKNFEKDKKQPRSIHEATANLRKLIQNNEI